MHHYAIIFSLGNEWHTHPFSRHAPFDGNDAALEAVRHELSQINTVRQSPFQPCHISLFSTEPPPPDGSFVIFRTLITTIGTLTG